MKNKFKTIPDAPNYEINFQGEIRNKTTGNFLQSNSPKVTLYNNGRCIFRSRKKLCRILFAEISTYTLKKDWQPVPSLNCKYELNSDGVLRNAKTKRLLKRYYPYAYAVKINGKVVYLSVRSLLWEVHGIIRPSTPKAVPVTVYHNGQRHYFPTKKDTAKFLSSKIFLSVSTINSMLCNRKTDICGWRITYHLPDDFS